MGAIFWKRKRMSVSCDEYSRTMAASSLLNYTERIHGRILSQMREVDTKGEGRETCFLYFTRVLSLVACKVGGVTVKGPPDVWDTGTFYV